MSLKDALRCTFILNLTGSLDSGVDSAYKPGLDTVPSASPTSLRLLHILLHEKQTMEISIPEGYSTLLNDKISYKLLSTFHVLAILPSALYLLTRFMYSCSLTQKIKKTRQSEINHFGHSHKSGQWKCKNLESVSLTARRQSSPAGVWTLQSNCLFHSRKHFERLRKCCPELLYILLVHNSYFCALYVNILQIAFACQIWTSEISS